jgi:D-apiose dehydrogenase
MNAAPFSDFTRPIRVGVIGAGYFSQFHLRGWARCPQAIVVAICDADFARAQAAANLHNITGCYQDVATMLASHDIDLVDVIVPPTHQGEVLRTTIAKNIPTICQKPFATSFEEASQLATLAAARDVPLIVHENFRFMPWFRETKRVIEAGQLGRTHGILFRLRPGDGQGEDAYSSRQPYFREMKRFLVAETAIHYIDTFRYLLGEVRAVTATLRRLNPAIQGEDAGIITFEFASGAFGVLDANRCNDHAAENQRRTMGEMWLDGSAGCLRLDGDARLWWKPHGEQQIAHPYVNGREHTDEFGNGACGALQAHVLAALSGQITIENAAERYLTNIQIQEAIYASHETGRKIVLADFSPPKTPQIPTL